jgi:hypothetical protein
MQTNGKLTEQEWTELLAEMDAGNPGPASTPDKAACTGECEYCDCGECPEHDEECLCEPEMSLDEERARRDDLEHGSTYWQPGD